MTAVLGFAFLIVLKAFGVSGEFEDRDTLPS